MKNVTMSDPCKGCTRVPDPANCDARRCAAWRKWFLYRWDHIHKFYEKWLREKGETK